MIVVKSLLIFIVGFLLVPISIPSSGKHGDMIDSLEHLTSYERRRTVFGYLEAAARILNKEGEREIFMKEIRNFALQKNDADLLKELLFIERKQTMVMDFPRGERENRCLEFIADPHNSGDLFFLAFCHHELGQILFQNQNYAQAFHHDLKALEIYGKIGFDKVPNIGKILHEIALHYYFFRDYEEVVKLMTISIEFPPFNQQLDMQRYNNLGMSYMFLGESDKALRNLHKGLSLAKIYKSEIWEELLYGNLGELHFTKKKFDSSLFYFRKNLNFNMDEDDHYTVKINSNVNMAKVFLEMDSVQKASNFLKTAESIFSFLEKDPSYVGAKYVGSRQQMEVARRQYYQTKTNFLKKLGQFDLAIKYQDSLLDIREEIERKYNSAVAKIASNKLIILNKEMQLVQKEQEKAEERLIYIGLVFSIMVLGVLGYFYMYISRLKRKRQIEKLIDTNRISKLEKEQSQKDLEIAKKEMSQFIAKFNKQSEIISNFEDDIKKLDGLKKNEQIQVREALNKMKKVKILTDEDWINFQNNFDTVFPDFRILLKQKTPTITASEMRYLMLSKLHLSHKEMARALGISDAAIRVTWNRVRKKFNGTLEDTPWDLIEKVKHGKKESVRE